VWLPDRGSQFFAGWELKNISYKWNLQADVKDFPKKILRSHLRNADPEKNIFFQRLAAGLRIYIGTQFLHGYLRTLCENFFIVNHP